MKEVVNTLWKKIREITQQEEPRDVGNLYALTLTLNELWKTRRSFFYPYSEQRSDEPKSE